CRCSSARLRVPFFVLAIPAPPRSTLFPYTTPFRSLTGGDGRGISRRIRVPAGAHLPPPWRLRHGRHGGANPDQERQPSECGRLRSEEHTSELQSLTTLASRLPLEKKKFKPQALTLA